ncbi:hypothetical protein RD792_008150 [Penstemon davidsonii]|uniref:Strictosidine synthase conserved region domain-containing protein n=1 Tax=Penstemon davidsonii TaxID=160366 RepID=A0ABR0D8C5_9LAMI|nr:hypothetical protein RD792_008150 [Penstemon davidsonii]
MATPLVYQAKAMSIKLILIAIAIAFFAIILVAFNHNTHSQPIKNESHESVIIPLPGGAVGPESFAFDGSGGGPYTGVSDGRIIRWRENENRWVDFAVTSPERNGCEGGHDNNIQMEHICGRPLGLRFNEKTGQLYIADAYMGLLVVGPNGGLATPVLKEADGVGLRFTNSLDIDQRSGVVYFTDSSSRYTRRNYISVIITSDNTGRLMKFDPSTNKTTLLLDNLKFPNGVSLSQNRDFLLFAETTTCRLYKYWLKKPKSENLELITQLPGFPDNIKRNKNGEFWVGINSKRKKSTELLISNPWIGNALVRYIPIDFTKLYYRLVDLIGSNGMGIRLSVDGNVVEVLDSKRWKFVSEVEENNGSLWIGSVTRDFVIKEKV